MYAFHGLLGFCEDCEPLVTDENRIGSLVRSKFEYNLKQEALRANLAKLGGPREAGTIVFSRALGPADRERRPKMALAAAWGTLGPGLEQVDRGRRELLCSPKIALAVAWGTSGTRLHQADRGRREP